MTTSAKTGACYTSLYGATVLAEVRAISGLPSHHHLLYSVTSRMITGFHKTSENFGIKRLFWGLLEGPLVSNTVWGGSACWRRVRRRQMNQRKRGRKWQILSIRTPATRALLALPFGQNFAPFGFAELAIASPDLKYELLCALGSGLPSHLDLEDIVLIYKCWVVL
jgi:hypothetical protein